MRVYLPKPKPTPRRYHTQNRYARNPGCLRWAVEQSVIVGVAIVYEIV
jgi:hypothetical protein